MRERRMTVEALHDLVPAAEEIDLADEAAVERRRARSERWLSGELVRLGLAPRETDEPVDAGRPDADDGPDALTDRQALGLLEHELGAEVIEPG